MLPQTVDRPVARQRDQPRHRAAARRVERVDASPRGRVDLLEEILGFPVIVKHAHDRPEHARRGQPVQLRESRLIAGCCLKHHPIQMFAARHIRIGIARRG